MISETWEWCLAPHKEDEIRERVLTDYKDICFNYLCSYSEMTDEFKIELAVLSLGKTGNGGIVPYITKDNYEVLYPVFKAAYLWVHGGCTGKAIPELFECLQIMEFEKGLRSHLEGLKRKVVKLREPDNIRSTEERIDRLEKTVKAFGILMSKKKVTSDFLKDELIDVFIDRLPTSQVRKEF